LKKKLTMCLTFIVLLFIIFSCSPASSAISTPSIPLGPTTGTVETSYSYSTKAAAPYGGWAKYTFDWGDNTPQSTTDLVKYGTTVSASHSWSKAGTYQVKAMITSKSGETSIFSEALLVTITDQVIEEGNANNPPATPSVPSGLATGSSGISYGYSTKATDPDGDRVKYTFDWGDGTTSDTSLVSSGASASSSHTWTVASGTTKTFSVRAKATDEGGKESSWSSGLSVTITGPALVNNPPATPSVPSGITSGTSGLSYSYSTKATDPDGDRVKYTFDWGDGTTSDTSLVSSGAYSACELRPQMRAAKSPAGLVGYRLP